MKLEVWWHQISNYRNRVPPLVGTEQKFWQKNPSESWKWYFLSFLSYVYQTNNSDLWEVCTGFDIRKLPWGSGKSKCFKLLQTCETQIKVVQFMICFLLCRTVGLFYFLQLLHCENRHVILNLIFLTCCILTSINNLAFCYLITSTFSSWEWYLRVTSVLNKRTVNPLSYISSFSLSIIILFHTYVLW